MRQTKKLFSFLRYACLLAVVILGLVSVIGTGGGSGSITYYNDADRDGFGNPDDRAVGDSSHPQGYVTDNTDCNDANAAINPGVTEACSDGVDNDCDGSVDEEDCASNCTDADDDGYYAQSGCGAAVDCHDANAAIHPGAAEVCSDGADNDCDGSVDDGCASNCTDADDDGYYAQSGCGTAVDCHDANAAVHPLAWEIYDDGLDNDCDGISASMYDADCDCLYDDCCTLDSYSIVWNDIDEDPSNYPYPCPILFDLCGCESGPFYAGAEVAISMTILVNGREGDHGAYFAEPYSKKVILSNNGEFLCSPDCPTDPVGRSVGSGKLAYQCGNSFWRDDYFSPSALTYYYWDSRYVTGGIVTGQCWYSPINRVVKITTDNLVLTQFDVDHNLCKWALAIPAVRITDNISPCDIISVQICLQAEDESCCFIYDLYHICCG